MALRSKPATPRVDLSINNTAADIIGGDDLATDMPGVELPPAPQAAPSTAGVPDFDSAANAGMNAQLPPDLQATTSAAPVPTPDGTPHIFPGTVPAAQAGIGVAPERTDDFGRTIMQDADGAPLNRNQKFTDHSVWETGIDAKVREAVLTGKLVRRMTSSDNLPVYRFFA